jgi:hypothetical protein
MYYPNHLPYHNSSFLLTEEENEKPQLVIPSFFDCYGYPETMRRLQLWINTAFAYRRFNHRTALEMLDIKSQLMRLLEAASMLTDSGLGDIPDANADLFNPRWYYNPSPGYTAWDFFPHHLSEQEYRTPYLVLEECIQKRTLPQWRSILDDLYDGACYRSTNGEEHSGAIYQDTNEDNIRQRCRQLLKLIEACHLILVREIANPGAGKAKAIARKPGMVKKAAGV